MLALAFASISACSLPFGQGTVAKDGACVLAGESDADTDADTDADSDADSDADTAVGTGTLQVTPAEVWLRDLRVSFSASEAFTLTNVGADQLILYEVDLFTNPEWVFYFERVEDVTLAPDESVAYYVVATLSTSAQVDGEIRITTNDPSAAEFLLPLHAVPAE